MHKLIWVLALAAMVGCGDSKPPAPAAGSGSSTAANPPAPPVAPPPSTGGSGTAHNPPAPPTAPPPAPPATPPGEKKTLEAANLGSITGTVKLDGDPVIKNLKGPEDDAFCNTQHEGKVKSEDFALGAGKTLGNILVYVKSGHEAWKAPAGEGEKVLDQVGCIYTPHVLSMTMGQSLKILTQDETNHNVNCQPKYSEKFNEQMNKATPARIWKPVAPELAIPFNCSIHPWMAAKVHVLEHPWHAVTGLDGKFTISGLAPGEYELAFWHEKMGTQTVKVTVGVKEAKTQDFTFKYEGK